VHLVCHVYHQDNDVQEVSREVLRAIISPNLPESQEPLAFLQLDGHKVNNDLNGIKDEPNQLTNIEYLAFFYLLKDNRKGEKNGQQDNLNDTKNRNDDKEKLTQLEALLIDKTHVHVSLERMVLDGLGGGPVSAQYVDEVSQDRFGLLFRYYLL
jgi:hypothetical protein